jgi:hypothetical protein
MDAGAIEAHEHLVWVDGTGRLISRGEVEALKNQFRLRDGKFDGLDWRKNPKFVWNT